MKKIPKAIDSQELQQNPKPAEIARDVESCCDKAALSDEELSRVSAAGTVYVPTMNPEVLLGRHAIPDGAEERRPQ